MLTAVCFAGIFLGITTFYYLFKADALEQENLSLRAQLRRATPTLTVEYADYDLDQDHGGGLTRREILDSSVIENQPIAYALTDKGWERASDASFLSDDLPEGRS